ncbi:MAG: outer membrane lipoprotein chaperone LolA [Terriglobales bacterium]
MLAQKLMRSFILALALLPAAALAQAAKAEKVEDVKAVASRVDAKYNRLQTLTADFTEIYSGLGMNRRESGSLTLKRSGKMRWDFVSPKQKLFVSDGKTAYFYVPEERQVRKASVKKLDDLHSPIRYLLGRSKLNSEFKDLKLEAGVTPSKPGNVILSGIPKHLADRVERVLLEISPESMIERIVIREIDGATTEFRFSNLIQNQAIADDRFRFQPPAGVETIESAELTGR